MKKKIIIARIVALIFASTAAAFLLPPGAAGEEMDFVPRVDDFTGMLDVSMAHVDSQIKTGGNREATSLYSTIERLKLGAGGYVYHPRFLSFRIEGVAGFDQSTYDSTWMRSRTSHAFDEYNATVYLLPEHPYNLELFTRRAIAALSPLYAQESITASRGALFRYRQNRSFSISAR